jgi:hypothetical protein
MEGKAEDLDVEVNGPARGTSEVALRSAPETILENESGKGWQGGNLGGKGLSHSRQLDGAEPNI